MSEKVSNLDDLPEFLNSHDLIKLGLFTSYDTVFLARKKGNSPDFVRIGRKVLYPKASVIAFVKKNLKNGSLSKSDREALEREKLC